MGFFARLVAYIPTSIGNTPIVSTRRRFQAVDAVLLPIWQGLPWPVCDAWASSMSTGCLTTAVRLCSAVVFRWRRMSHKMKWPGSRRRRLLTGEL
jgi:hypothetical protein